ncbi:hypothetical protein [Azospirillum tabaci]|uniref:hypothetical protein n=1 Tax=Azospirillum tabaci TaxID=2752310 RepID=UPI0016600E57|nr:hypothetical protein [Azospirillum tabaci]
MTDEDRRFVRALRERSPSIATAADLITRFRETVKGTLPNPFDGWLREAEVSAKSPFTAEREESTHASLTMADGEHARQRTGFSRMTEQTSGWRLAARAVIVTISAGHCPINLGEARREPAATQLRFTVLRWIPVDTRTSRARASSRGDWVFR